MTTHPPDQPNREIIEHELNQTLLVEAAAGTGKTTGMIQRMIALLREKKTTVEHIAAVTFTRKAASELRARFQAQLEEEAKTASPQTKVRFLQALDHLDQSFIGTIHSFCARLLRERPVEAGIDLAFQELDDIEDSLLRKQAWDEYVARLYAHNDPILGEIEKLGLRLPQLEEVFMRFADFPDVDQWPSDPPPSPDFSSLKQKIRSYAHYMEQFSTEFSGYSGNDKLIPLYRIIPRLVSYAREDRLASWMNILERFGLEEREKLVIQKDWPGKKEQALAEQELWNRFIREVAAPNLRSWYAIRYHLILQAIQPAIDDYQRLKQASGSLNFQDLLLLTARLLRNYPEVRKDFSQRYTHLLIDEFQDTDPIQAEVMLLLTATDPQEQDWTRCRPRKGSLFVVGDPKQSIYRFRRADIVTYNRVKTIIQQSGGKLISLSANFRTIPSVLTWVNDVFAQHFPSKANEYAPQYIDLLPGKNEPHAKEDNPIQKIEIPNEHKKNDDILLHESSLIADTILHQIQHHQRQPGDFMIITRNTKNLSLYAQQLQERKIPHRVSGGTSLNDIRQLRELHTCLLALTQPDNPVYLVAVLRGSLFGLSDPQLFEFKQAGGAFHYHYELPTDLSAETREQFSYAFACLKRYNRWLHHYPPISAIQKIMDNLGLTAQAVLEPGGNEKTGGLLKALEVLRDLQKSFWSLEDLLTHLDEMITQEIKYDTLPALPQEDSHVQIMNLHKAKGLEAPVVFLADPTGDFDHGVDTHIDRTGSTSTGYLCVTAQRGYHPKPIAQPLAWQKIEPIEKQFLEAEDTRLFYVAATRAGEKLTISQRQTFQNRNPWKFFQEALSNAPQLTSPQEKPTPIITRSAIVSEDIKQSVQRIKNQWEETLQPTYEVRAAKTLAHMPPSGDPAPEESGMKWGNVIHLLLWHAMQNPHADLTPLAHNAFRSEELNLEHLPAALETIQSVIQSPIWQRALQSPRRFMEVPFSIQLENDPQPVLIRGIIDLAFEEEGEWIIVDYKTDTGTPKTIQQKALAYRPQIDTYAACWQRMTQQPVKEAGLYFTYSGEYLIPSKMESN